jgi:hypothetical protein
MENVNVRRGFLKGFGLLGAAAGGFLAAQNSFANTPPPSPIGSPASNQRDLGPVEDIAHLAPLGLVNIHFQADNRPPPPPPPLNHYTGYTMSSGGDWGIGIGNMASTEGHNNVKMSVGKDNRLWIEVDGQWRRVALEG